LDFGLNSESESREIFQLSCEKFHGFLLLKMLFFNKYGGLENGTGLAILIADSADRS